jgi:glycosyltransferase involved in cell wall biosynthesis
MTKTSKSCPSVLIVSYGLIAGGGETFPIYLANALRSRGWPVAFLDYGKEEPEPGVRNMLEVNVPLYRLRDDAHIARLCRELAVDIVHTCHTSTDLVMARKLQELPDAQRPRQVVTLHGGYEAMSLPDLLMVLPALDHVDHFTYAASKNLDNFPTRFLSKKPFTRIANAVPPSKGDSEARHRSDVRISHDSLIAMLIARAIPGKGWEAARIAVEAARATSQRDIHLILIGDGPVYDQMKAGELPDWVHLLGFQADLRSWISLADLALLPTTFSGESFPLVLMEFLAMGVPAIASSIGEIPQMLSSSRGLAGYLLELTDGQIAPAQLTSLIEDFSLLEAGDREELRARALSAAEKFDFETMVRAFEGVYASLAR